MKSIKLPHVSAAGAILRIIYNKEIQAQNANIGIASHPVE